MKLLLVLALTLALASANQLNCADDSCLSIGPLFSGIESLADLSIFSDLSAFASYSDQCFPDFEVPSVAEILSCLLSSPGQLLSCAGIPVADIASGFSITAQCAGKEIDLALPADFDLEEFLSDIEMGGFPVLIDAIDSIVDIADDLPISQLIAHVQSELNLAAGVRPTVESFLIDLEDAAEEFVIAAEEVAELIVNDLELDNGVLKLSEATVLEIQGLLTMLEDSAIEIGEDALLIFQGVADDIRGAITGLGTFRVAAPASSKRQLPFDFDFGGFDWSEFVGDIEIEDVLAVIDATVEAVHDIAISGSGQLSVELAGFTFEGDITVSDDGEISVSASFNGVSLELSADTVYRAVLDAVEEVSAQFSDVVSLDGQLVVDICAKSDFSASVALDSAISIISSEQAITTTFAGCILVDCDGVEVTDDDCVVEYGENEVMVSSRSAQEKASDARALVAPLAMMAGVAMLF